MKWVRPQSSYPPMTSRHGKPSSMPSAMPSSIPSATPTSMPTQGEAALLPAPSPSALQPSQPSLAQETEHEPKNVKEFLQQEVGRPKSSSRRKGQGSKKTPATPNGATPKPPGLQPHPPIPGSESKPGPDTNSDKLPLQEEVARSKSSSKSKGQASKKTSGEKAGKGDAHIELSEEEKLELAKYIYDVMVEKEFNSPEGHLLVDVLIEVRKDLGKEFTRDGHLALHPFERVLRAAPQYFKVFREKIEVARSAKNHKALFAASKGEHMVRLVPQTST